jgi:hypothetical protein
MVIRDLVDTWASLYANSPALRSALSFVHIGALLGGGGCAIAADRTVLRALRQGRHAVASSLRELGGIHRVVVGGLALVMASGILLALADVDTYIEAPTFWVKMAFVAALTFNGALLVRAGHVVRTGTSGLVLLRATTIASLALWFATTLAGAILPNAL